jgi:hypothetical protein
MANATRSFRPANGTEGMIFDDAWCSRCQRDDAWRRDDSAEPCDILSRTFIYSTDDPEYPKEWVEDDVPYPLDSRPRCAAFLPIGAAEGSTYVADIRQGELFPNDSAPQREGGDG